MNNHPVFSLVPYNMEKAQKDAQTIMSISDTTLNEWNLPMAHLGTVDWDFAPAYFDGIICHSVTTRLLPFQDNMLCGR